MYLIVFLIETRIKFTIKCNNCGNELSSVSDEELKHFVFEFLNTFRPKGILKGVVRIVNYWRGQYSDNVCKVEGYYYCETCKTYKIVCSNCKHVIELARNHPFQRDSYECPICRKTLIFYNETDGEFYDQGDYYP